MTIEALDSITIRLDGKSQTLQPGETVDLPVDKARLLLERAPGRVRCVMPTALICPGSWITWTRADGSQPVGQVDYLHVDDRGTKWAFVSFSIHWSAVNCKFATVKA